MRTDEALSRLRDRLDRVWTIEPPTDDVEDYRQGYADALAAVKHVLTTDPR